MTCPTPRRSDSDALFALDGQLARALAASSRDRRGEVLSWHVDLDPSEPAGLALRRVLGRYLEIMRANEPGLLADVNSEFLHDFRVAVRRSRSILRETAAALPEAVARHAASELSWLGTTTNWMRDLDVFVLQIRERVRAGGKLWTQVGGIIGHVEAARRDELTRVRRALRSRRWRDFHELWAAELGSPLSEDEPQAAQRAVAELASARISHLHRKVLGSVKKLSASSPVDEFHALRIRCKKLRYMTDAFGGFYPKKGVRRLVRHLKRLQELLGEFNDLDVQRDTLRRVAEEVGGPAPAELLAMGRLVERYVERSEALRPEILSRLERFAASVDRARLERLLARAKH